MPKGLSMAAAVDVDFTNDARLDVLTCGQRWGYLCWWLQAVKVRKEFLPEKDGSVQQVVKSHNIGKRLAQTTFDRCVQNGLLQLHTIDGVKYVRVVGVRKKHGFLKLWNDEEEGELALKIGLEKGEPTGSVLYRTVPSRVFGGLPPKKVIENVDKSKPKRQLLFNSKGETVKNSEGELAYDRPGWTAIWNQAGTKITEWKRKRGSK